MDLIALMRVFRRVAEARSFSCVARELGSTQSKVSKQIARLEADYGIRLFNRSTRVVHLTDAGELFLAYCTRMLDISQETEEAFGRLNARPTGLVRISGPLAFSRVHLAARTASLLREHPALQIELVADDRDGDLVELGYDVAVRFGELEGTSMIARRIGTTTRVTVATPTYLARCGEPLAPADLVNHNCLIYTRLGAPRLWEFVGPAGPLTVRVGGNFHSNNSDVIREAVLADIGVAVMPDWLFRTDLNLGRLRPILRDFEPQNLPIHLVHPARRFVSPKVRTVLDFLTQDLRNDPAFRATSRAEASIET